MFANHFFWNKLKSVRLTVSLSTALGLMVLIGAMNSKAVQIIGHRGASYDAPENTLSSIKLGYEQGADADELDIHLTKDGKIVVIHDNNTKRTGGTNLFVQEQDFQTLRQVDVGNFGAWKDKGGFCEKIPLLSEVLDLVPEKKALVIEIKCGPEVLQPLKTVLEQSGKRPDQTIIIGFAYETVKQAKQLFPYRRVLWLCSWKEDKITKKTPDIDHLIQKAREAKLDGLDLDCKAPIDKDFVAKIKNAGLLLYTWTVDDPETARKEVEAGVDGITTNRPGWLREQLKFQGLK